MRRFVFLLLLVILPIQFGWSPALAYCRHETGSAAQHLGHHEHRHNVTPDDKRQDAKAASVVNVDVDCGTCQFSTTPVIPSSLSNVAVPVPEAPQFAYRVHCGLHIPSGPERPDRA